MSIIDKLLGRTPKTRIPQVSVPVIFDTEVGFQQGKEEAFLRNLYAHVSMKQDVVGQFVQEGKGVYPVFAMIPLLPLALSFHGTAAELRELLDALREKKVSFRAGKGY